MIETCPVCGFRNLEQIFKHPRLPHYNLHYFATAEAASEADAGPVQFVQCLRCYFVFNAIYEQLRYDKSYDASRSHSFTFRVYLEEVIKRVRASTTNSVRNVVEVGAGDSAFARLWIESSTEISQNYFGFDPSWKIPESLHDFGASFYRQIPSYYGSNFRCKPDLLVLRHVLEHQSDVLGFLNKVLFELPNYVMIEVPCWEFVRNGHWHFFSYEHCSYFAVSNLEMLMNKLGYTRVFSEYMFNDENIVSLWSRDQHTVSPQIAEKDRLLGMTSNYREWLDGLRGKVANSNLVWGASGKGVMLINLLQATPNMVPYLVDNNPALQGKFVPCMGNKIISPAELKNLDFEPTSILVCNPLYLSEIEMTLKMLGSNCKAIPFEEV